MGRGAVVLHNADIHFPVGVEERIHAIGPSAVELAANDGPGMQEELAVAVVLAVLEISDIFAAVGFEVYAETGKDGPVERADQQSALFVVQLTVSVGRLADIGAAFQANGVDLLQIQRIRLLGDSQRQTYQNGG